MRNFLLTTTFVIFVFFVQMSNLSAKQQSMVKELAQDFKKAHTLEEIENATNKIQENRSETINSLKRLLETENDKEKRIRICYLLGEYRASEAILDLAKIINLEADIPPFSRELPRWRKYPAQEALVKCGARSIPYMISNIESNDGELIQKLSTEVIWQVMGTGLSRVLDGKDYARMIIEKRINEETDSVKKARLQSSLKYLGRTEGIN